MTPLEQAVIDAAEQAIMLPVQRQNMHGGQMAPDTMVALPVVFWEAILDQLPDSDEPEKPMNEWPAEYWESME